MPSDMPSPGPEHARLAQLEGTWEGDEDLAPSPRGPGGRAWGRIVMTREVDGFFLLQDYLEELDGRVVFRGHGVVGWDPMARAYSWYWVDSTGVPGVPMSGRWEGEALTFTRDGPQGGLRCTWRIAGRRLSFEAQAQSPGQGWVRMMAGTYERL
jgi:hypothetical protein